MHTWRPTPPSDLIQGSSTNDQLHHTASPSRTRTGKERTLPSHQHQPQQSRQWQTSLPWATRSTKSPIASQMNAPTPSTHSSSRALSRPEGWHDEDRTTSSTGPMDLRETGEFYYPDLNDDQPYRSYATGSSCSSAQSVTPTESSTSMVKTPRAYHNDMDPEDYEQQPTARFQPNHPSHTMRTASVKRGPFLCRGYLRTYSIQGSRPAWYR